MNRCHVPGCTRRPQYRLELSRGHWRTWLRLPPRIYQVCGEHRFDPITRAHTGWLHHG